MTQATLLDARVEYGPAALEIRAPLIDGTIEGGGFRMVADRAQAYLEIASVADFAVSEGSRVRVNPHPGARPTEVDAYLRGTVAAMLLGQRGRFALHATLDVKHSEAWNREVLRPLVAENPDVAAAIAEGALMRLAAGARCFERYRKELRLGAELGICA